ncbi:MAG TPA: methyltransferase domain-containing protein [Steroidobacteraceae bacterium]|nr:methyltransferase domain-containing protein [Steroidobacteraceae bacterium]
MNHSITHNYHNPLTVAGILLRDKSLYRAHVNLALRDRQLHGAVLDLGSKSPNASYYRYFRREEPLAVTCTDLAPGEGLVCLDVEKPFALDAESFDHVLAINLFEHVRHFDRAPAEVLRILKPGGRVIIVVPFLHEYHADPQDYFRYTDSGLRSIWESAGFESGSIEALGDGILTFALTKTAQQVLPRFVRPLVSTLLYLLSYPFDRIVGLRPRVGGRSVPERFPLGYVAVFRKPAP